MKIQILLSLICFSTSLHIQAMNINISAWPRLETFEKTSQCNDEYGKVFINLKTAMLLILESRKRAYENPNPFIELKQKIKNRETLKEILTPPPHLNTILCMSKKDLYHRLFPYITWSGHESARSVVNGWVCNSYPIVINNSIAYLKQKPQSWTSKLFYGLEDFSINGEISKLSNDTLQKDFQAFLDEPVLKAPSSRRVLELIDE